MANSIVVKPVRALRRIGLSDQYQSLKLPTLTYSMTREAIWTQCRLAYHHSQLSTMPGIRRTDRNWKARDAVAFIVGVPAKIASRREI